MFCGTIWMGTLEVKYTSSRNYMWTFNGTIYVENLSYNKKVGIHWQSESGAWADMDATYHHSLLVGGGSRVDQWTITGVHSSYIAPPPNLRFAAYYHNIDWGVSYWDNNGGSDYYVPITP